MAAIFPGWGKVLWSFGAPFMSASYCLIPGSNKVSPPGSLLYRLLIPYVTYYSALLRTYICRDSGHIWSFTLPMLMHFRHKLSVHTVSRLDIYHLYCLCAKKDFEKFLEEAFFFSKSVSSRKYFSGCHLHPKSSNY